MTLASIYMTTGQAASRLSVNRLTIQRWVASGRLSGERVGNVTLIPIVEVEAILRQHLLDDAVGTANRLAALQHYPPLR